MCTVKEHIPFTGLSYHVRKGCEFNQEMQQSRTIDKPRHREEEAKNDNRTMTYIIYIIQ